MLYQQRHLPGMILFFQVFIQANGLVDPLCQVNRIDVVPCSPNDPDNTLQPAENQYGIYTTRIVEGEDTLNCVIVKDSHQIRNIQANGPRVKLLYSPGFELASPQEYGNQMYVKYNIACPNDDDITFFSVRTIDMEEKTCSNLHTQEKDCVDYLRVYRSGGAAGVTESCGTDAAGNNEQLDQSNLKMVFRSSDTLTFPGFKAVVVCLPAASSGMGRRRKRDLDEFNDQWRRYLKTVQLFGAVEITKRSCFNRFETETIVPYGTSVTFKNGTLLLNTVSTSKTHSISNVNLLRTFDTYLGVTTYIDTAESDGDLINFNGGGNLTVVADRAYFTLFLINPQGILPENEEERKIINQLSDAHFNSDLQRPDERLCDAFVHPPPIDFYRLLNSTREPATEPSIDCPLPASNKPFPSDFSNKEVSLAKENQDSTNAVIRVLSEAIIKCSSGCGQP